MSATITGHLVPRRRHTNWPVALLSVPPPKSKHATRRLRKVVLQLEDLERHKGRQQFSGRTGPRPSNTTKPFLHFASRLKSSPQQTSSLRPPTNFFLMKMHVMATNSVSSHEGGSVDKQWLFCMWFEEEDPGQMGGPAISHGGPSDAFCRRLFFSVQRLIALARSLSKPESYCRLANSAN